MNIDVDQEEVRQIKSDHFYEVRRRLMRSSGKKFVSDTIDKLPNEFRKDLDQDGRFTCRWSYPEDYL